MKLVFPNEDVIAINETWQMLQTMPKTLQGLKHLVPQRPTVSASL